MFYDHPNLKIFYIYIYIYILLKNILFTKLTLWGSKNLGPCGGLKYHILSIMHPRRGNHRETS